jgi:hypothetical protein
VRARACVCVHVCVCVCALRRGTQVYDWWGVCGRKRDFTMCAGAHLRLPAHARPSCPCMRASTAASRGQVVCGSGARGRYWAGLQARPWRRARPRRERQQRRQRQRRRRLRGSASLLLRLVPLSCGRRPHLRLLFRDAPFLCHPQQQDRLQRPRPPESLLSGHTPHPPSLFPPPSSLSATAPARAPSF